MILIKGNISPVFIAECISEFEEQTGTGAYTTFIGQVRDDFIEGKKVKEIEYSAYEEMVEKEINAIKEKVHLKYDEIQEIMIFHSTGIVKAGQISLLVIVSARHRNQLFDSLHDVVELIKENLPVWKKEIFEDNTHIWTNNEEK